MPPTGMAAIDSLRRARPDIRLIVIGPEGDDELVMNSIIAGARAYLDPTAGPEIGSPGHRGRHRGLHLGAAPLALPAH